MAEELERAASPRQMVPGAVERNYSSAVFKSTLSCNGEQNDSGIGIDSESLRSGEYGGIESGEKVEEDRLQTLRTDSRQPKAEQEALRRNEIRHAHADTFGSLTSAMSIASATIVAPGKTQRRNVNYMHVSVSEQRLTEQRLQDEEQRIVRYLLPNRDGDT